MMRGKYVENQLHGEDMNDYGRYFVLRQLATFWGIYPESYESPM